MKCRLFKLQKQQRGQALVEYILILAIAVTSIGLLVRGLRTTLQKTWKVWNQEIQAPCPDCAPPGARDGG